LVCEEIAQNVAQHIFVEINGKPRLWKKVAQKCGQLSEIKKTAQSKQSPNGRKFAQSGHPGTGSKN
jgi:ABC-type Zn uptake system ZnuABC Zn-binding protein ZnuA